MNGLLALALAAALAAPAAEPGWAKLPGNPAFRSVLAYEDTRDGVRVRPFELLRTPVSNGDFLAFVKTQPHWRWDRGQAVFAAAR